MWKCNPRLKKTHLKNGGKQNMADLKEIFSKAEDGTMTYEQFIEAAKEVGAKFKDISTGDYVSTSKYNADLEAKTAEIETLNGTISTRDTDLAELQKKLADAGTDATKLDTLSKDFTKLQKKYDDDVKSYQQQLQKQAYDFAVKSYAATLDFSSEAARRDFTNQMLGAELKLEGDTLIGATDFKAAYEANNADAFKVVAPDPEPTHPTPDFVGGAPGGAGQPTEMTLSELMQAKNNNPDLKVQFVD